MVGDLRIDLLAHDVHMKDQQLELTKREFDLLLFLARSAGHAVSRDRILQNAWGGSSDVTPNAVDVYIGYVRRKMQAVSESPTIRTVRGVGFRLTK